MEGAEDSKQRVNGSREENLDEKFFTKDIVRSRRDASVSEAKLYGKGALAVLKRQTVMRSLHAVFCKSEDAMQGRWHPWAVLHTRKTQKKGKRSFWRLIELTRGGTVKPTRCRAFPPN